MAELVVDDTSSSNCQTEKYLHDSVHMNVDQLGYAENFNYVILVNRMATCYFMIWKTMVLNCSNIYTLGDCGNSMCAGTRPLCLHLLYIASKNNQLSWYCCILGRWSCISVVLLLRTFIVLVVIGRWRHQYLLRCHKDYAWLPLLQFVSLVPTRRLTPHLCCFQIPVED